MSTWAEAFLLSVTLGTRETVRDALFEFSRLLDILVTANMPTCHQPVVTINSFLKSHRLPSVRWSVRAGVNLPVRQPSTTLSDCGPASPSAQNSLMELNDLLITLRSPI